MALSGLEIYKLLPSSKTDKGARQLQGMRFSHLPGLCHEAGRQAGGAVDLPLRERGLQGQAVRGRCAADPPDHAARRRPQGRVGNETVLFRHEKTFYHPTGVCWCACPIPWPQAEIAATAKAVADTRWTTSASRCTLDGLAVEAASGNAGQFAGAVAAAARRRHPAVGADDRRPGRDGGRPGEDGRRRRPCSARRRPPIGKRWRSWPRQTRRRWSCAPTPSQALAELTREAGRGRRRRPGARSGRARLQRLAGGADPAPSAGAQEGRPRRRLPDHRLPLPGRWPIRAWRSCWPASRSPSTPAWWC